MENNNAEKFFCKAISQERYGTSFAKIEMATESEIRWPFYAHYVVSLIDVNRLFISDYWSSKIKSNKDILE
ncbi:hypothetical protein [Desulforhopalus sp. IMCC35007]|uniref:hypothetical protein n=1 Tax=Desulforhopalus sp. IMCC35007 TaxID=2569543 RepID=UPI0010AE1229|nr:hypothetical protein [Desulforhopalus sp. IMCC35007]TKB08049.1 hypothetical protein FCL48_15470 [Desulforhopalus sp. IMCC35007]